MPFKKGISGNPIGRPVGSMSSSIKLSVIERLIGILVKVLISSYWEIVRFMKNFKNEKTPTYITMLTNDWFWADSISFSYW